ncbi:flavodoxin family protein [Herbivorax sp. ANBcel31]|uniref:flavodoxin family protein n=1 Tax=Herbivorax sp. ANBcel31 TaxID=3069754 RepID=UPI0027B583A5|nr:flavodoxin family protein [Herbivorax sp. ANBcel31]MDQ2086796.1 flavodoxin family protein [Herbivorax sp. ANBcel31]
MLIVGLNGSPNKSGNTKVLINAVLDKVKELGAETVVYDVQELLNSAKHNFCVACSSPCSGICYKDSKLEEAFEVLKKADGVIFGSPSYFGTVSGQLKSFFDKTRKLRSEKALYNTVGAGVTVGASKYGGQETTIKALHDMMIVQGMMIVGDGYVEDDCGHHGVCAHKPADKDDFAIKRADILAKRMFEVCKKG